MKTKLIFFNACATVRSFFQVGFMSALLLRKAISEGWIQAYARVFS